MVRQLRDVAAGGCGSGSDGGVLQVTRIASSSRRSLSGRAVSRGLRSLAVPTITDGQDVAPAVSLMSATATGAQLLPPLDKIPAAPKP
ncbi:hypothetical protein AQJ54_20315 [Streptomyces griseorubiginosus]|uniref:Uncharacterized protein n=2 Tax=Streptomyces griseorubiginosus TaxID=67304 RepID=A0A101S0Q5_9ACTN|nr:hypothetical protein AQJ54_20315 [Streptomyces griseorubiginosus]